MKSILFLGGGKLGLPAIKWAKKIGFNIIVNDVNMGAHGVKLADVVISYDSTDVRNISTWALKNNIHYNIKYCYCSSDFGLVTAVIVHDVLQIVHPPVSAIMSSLDKGLMKNCWEGHENIFTPKSIKIRSETELIDACDKSSFPLVLKPLDSSGSRGVSVLHNEKEIKDAYIEAKRYSLDGFLLLEEYIDGAHHDVNGLFWSEKFYECGVMDRHFISGKYPVSYKGNYPSILTTAKQSEIYEILKEASILLGIKEGPVKADFVIKNGVPYLFEVSPRFHGDIVTSRTLGFLGELNPIYQLFNFIYNEEYNFIPIHAHSGKGSWKAYFDEKEIEHHSNYSLHQIRNKTSDTIKNNTNYVALGWIWEDE
jgi:biotin carboxylase